MFPVCSIPNSDLVRYSILREISSQSHDSLHVSCLVVSSQQVEAEASTDYGRTACEGTRQRRPGGPAVSSEAVHLNLTQIFSLQLTVSHLTLGLGGWPYLVYSWVASASEKKGWKYPPWWTRQWGNCPRPLPPPRQGWTERSRDLTGRQRSSGWSASHSQTCRSEYKWNKWSL